MNIPDNSFYIRNIYDLPEPFYFFNIFTRSEEYLLPEHVHDRFHVNLITDGTVEVRTSAGVMEVNAGFALIIPPGLFHELYSKNGYSQIGMDICDINDKYNLVSKLKEICSGNAVKLKLGNSPAMTAITRKTIVDLTPLAELKCINAMTNLLLSIIENSNSANAIGSDFHQKFISAVESSYDGNINLKQLCNALDYSQTHLERLVKAEFGCGVIEYVNRMRFIKICSLLTGTSLTLAEISEQCGFYDSSHLSVFFKKRSRMTPLKYRQNEQ